MKLLLKAIVAVVLVGCGPSKSIHQAAYEGNLEAVKQHLAAGKDVNAPDRSGFTPLHVAANYGQKEIVELLIAKSTLTLKGSLSSANHWHFLATDLGKA